MVRHQAHAKKAAEAFATSKFYRSYPSKTKDPTKSSLSGRKGFFENLALYVALGFTLGDKEVTKRLTNKVEGDGTFFFDQEEISEIDGMNKRGQNTWEAKCEDMVSYLIELGFDLSISVLDNVSENPGFESCHGTW